MIVKALLALAGLRAAPPLMPIDVASALHSDTVHDALNVRAGIMAAHARIVRLSAAGNLAAAAGDIALGATIAERSSEVRAALDDVARRLD